MGVQEQKILERQPESQVLSLPPLILKPDRMEWIFTIFYEQPLGTVDILRFFFFFIIAALTLRRGGAPAALQFRRGHGEEWPGPRPRGAAGTGVPE